MTAKTAILPESNLVIFAINFARDRRVTDFSFFRGTTGQNFPGNRFQRFALFRCRLLIDVIIREVPVAEGIHHRLAFRALPHICYREAVEFHPAVVAFLNEEHLTAAAGHLGWFGIEPTRPSCITRTGLFQLAGNFPWSFVLWFIGCT